MSGDWSVRATSRADRARSCRRSGPERTPPSAALRARCRSAPSTSGATPLVRPTRPTASAARRRTRASPSVSSRIRSAARRCPGSSSTALSSSLRIHAIFCSKARRSLRADRYGGAPAGALAHARAVNAHTMPIENRVRRTEHSAEDTIAMISSAPPCSSVTSRSKGRSARAKPR